MCPQLPSISLYCGQRLCSIRPLLAPLPPPSLLPQIWNCIETGRLIPEWLVWSRPAVSCLSLHDPILLGKNSGGTGVPKISTQLSFALCLCDAKSSSAPLLHPKCWPCGKRGEAGMDERKIALLWSSFMASCQSVRGGAVFASKISALWQAPFQSKTRNNIKPNGMRQKRSYISKAPMGLLFVFHYCPVCLLMQNEEEIALMKWSLKYFHAWFWTNRMLTEIEVWNFLAYLFSTICYV